MSEEKNVSCRLPLHTHNKLTDRLRNIIKGKKVSVGDLIAAAIEIPDDVLQPLVRQVLKDKVRKRSEAVGLSMKVRATSAEAQAKIQAIIDEEENS